VPAQVEQEQAAQQIMPLHIWGKASNQNQVDHSHK
jgi:hypothetical protein